MHPLYEACLDLQLPGEGSSNAMAMATREIARALLLQARSNHGAEGGDLVRGAFIARCVAEV